MTTPTPHDDGETLKGIADNGTVCCLCGSSHYANMAAGETFSTCTRCYDRYHADENRLRAEYARRVSNMLATAPKSELPISIVALAQRLDSEQISDRQRYGLEGSITLNSQERASLHAFLRAAQNYYHAKPSPDPRDTRIASLESELSAAREASVSRVGSPNIVECIEEQARVIEAKTARAEDLESELARLKAPARCGEEPAIIQAARDVVATMPGMPGEREWDLPGWRKLTHADARELVAFLDRAPAASVPSDLSARLLAVCSVLQNKPPELPAGRDPLAWLEQVAQQVSDDFDHEGAVLKEALRVADVRRERVEKLEAELVDARSEFEKQLAYWREEHRLVQLERNKAEAELSALKASAPGVQKLQALREYMADLVKASVPCSPLANRVECVLAEFLESLQPAPPKPDPYEQAGVNDYDGGRMGDRTKPEQKTDDVCPQKKVTCSFCHGEHRVVAGSSEFLYIKGYDAHICEACIDLAAECLAERRACRDKTTTTPTSSADDATRKDACVTPQGEAFANSAQPAAGGRPDSAVGSEEEQERLLRTAYAAATNNMPCTAISDLVAYLRAERDGRRAGR